MNFKNLYWFMSLLGARSIGSTISEAQGGQTMNVKWFAFNLNWFDVGVTLSFGDLQQQQSRLKITNSSYHYAKPGLASPIAFMVVAVAVALNVRTSEYAFSESLAIAVATFMVVHIIESRSKIGVNINMPTSTKQEKESPFHIIPEARRLVDDVHIRYYNEPSVVNGGDEKLLNRLIANTPLPKGKTEFSSIHVIGPPKAAGSEVAEKIMAHLESCATVKIKKELHLHRLPDCCCTVPRPTAMEEYAAIFTVASDLILTKADRASLLVFVGWEDSTYDFYAAVVGMLPFRGVSTALVTQRTQYGDMLCYKSPSTVFEIEGSNAARMGMFPIKAIFGPLHDKTLVQAIDEWQPVDISPYIDRDATALSSFINDGDEPEHPTINLPFKIGALTLPMLTHNGAYQSSISALADLLNAHHGDRYFPIVSCGDTCDALGYGEDILAACGQQHGYYFCHRSGETYKCWENYGTEELFEKIAFAKKEGLPVVIVAVGGGVNGNCIGLIAACTNSHLVEVPTTPMHYNDATTSAKKAFSLVKENRILSKNILGAFYIPELVFCVSETFLTLSSANVHATIGESCKTMNMLGMTNTAVGAQDYFNIEGGIEFASDCTKIVQHVGGFDALVKFIEDPETRAAKREIVQVGSALRVLRTNPTQDDPARKASLLEERMALLGAFRKRYYDLGTEKTLRIKEFLSVVNREIVLAKAMFLAYSDPFEKYRALLFEYAHTLGHGIEAYANLAYQMAADRGIEVPESAVRLHGQCVGMAVLWAGQMSFDLGELKGNNFDLHQGFVYLFNRHGGFDFMPLRRLFDQLGITKAEFCEGVLDVVRRDNKRGYCNCSDASKSVDQLVTGRPGKMMRSTDKNAELRYLVEVDEAWQERVLNMAYDGHFDKVADMNEEGKLKFINRNKITTNKRLVSSSSDVGAFIHKAMKSIYGGSRRLSLDMI